MVDDAISRKKALVNTNRLNSNTPSDEKVASFLAGKESIYIWPDHLGPDDETNHTNALLRATAALHKYKRGLKFLTTVTSSPTIARDVIGALSCCRFKDTLHMAVTATQRLDIYNDKIVSRAHKYIWIGNTKVASRSLIAALLGVDPNAEIIRNRSMADIYAVYPEVKNYYSFTFVRHPFYRTLSLYLELWSARQHYTEMFRPRQERKRQHIFQRFFGLVQVRSFDDYCRWLNTWYGSDSFADRHFLSQHLLIRLDGNRLPDFVGRLENIQSDLSRIASHLDMPTPRLPRLNTMAGWQATPESLRIARATTMNLLTERNKTSLRKRYADDFELGDYSSA